MEEEPHERANGHDFQAATTPPQCGEPLSSATVPGCGEPSLHSPPATHSDPEPGLNLGGPDQAQNLLDVIPTRA